MNTVRWVLLGGVAALSACVSPSGNDGSAPGIVLPAQGSSEGEVQPGGPITPVLPGGEPTPLPNTQPPLSPNLPKSIEASGAAAPVISLVKTARAALKSGRPDQAGSSLERALRIEPRNPWVWQALASLHVLTQQGEQAESEAKKAISLGKRNPYLDVESWRLIAEARKQRRDFAGAAAAESRHESLQRLISP